MSEAMSQLTDGYVAGFVDGDGSIGFGLTKFAGPEHQTRNVRPYLIIANTNRQILELVKQKFAAGNIYVTIVIKKKQAELVLEFIELRLQHFGGNPKYRKGYNKFAPYSERELDIIRKIRAMNITRRNQRKYSDEQYEVILKELGK